MNWGKLKEIRKRLIERFQESDIAQVPGYNQFSYIRETGNAVYVTRETGKDTRIGFDIIETAIQAVRMDTSVYHKGPSALRAYGITHVNSPTWAIIHLLPLSELLD